MNSILVEAWDALKVSSVKFIMDRFLKIKLLPLSPTNFTTNFQACAASVQVNSGANYEETNDI